MMSRLVILFLLLTGSCATNYLTGVPVSVADGDTFTLLVGNVPHKIRLHGIDCPERGQPFSRVATQFTKTMLVSGKVRVREMGTDRYGRVVGMVYVDNVNLNERLLEAGLAWHYTDYDQNPHWAALEQAAREARRGLWQEPDAIAPWRWRKGDRPAR